MEYIASQNWCGRRACVHSSSSQANYEDILQRIELKAINFSVIRNYCLLYYRYCHDDDDDDYYYY